MGRSSRQCSVAPGPLSKTESGGGDPAPWFPYRAEAGAGADRMASGGRSPTGWKTPPRSQVDTVEATRRNGPLVGVRPHCGAAVAARCARSSAALCESAIPQPLRRLHVRPRHGRPGSGPVDDVHPGQLDISEPLLAPRGGRHRSRRQGASSCRHAGARRVAQAEVAGAGPAPSVSDTRPLGGVRGPIYRPRSSTSGGHIARAPDFGKHWGNVAGKEIDGRKPLPAFRVSRSYYSSVRVLCQTSLAIGQFIHRRILSS